MFRFSGIMVCRGGTPVRNVFNLECQGRSAVILRMCQGVPVSVHFTHRSHCAGQFRLRHESRFARTRTRLNPPMPWVPGLLLPRLNNSHTEASTAASRITRAKPRLCHTGICSHLRAGGRGWTSQCSIATDSSGPKGQHRAVWGSAMDMDHSRFPLSLHVRNRSLDWYMRCWINSKDAFSRHLSSQRLEYNEAKDLM